MAQPFLECVLIGNQPIAPLLGLVQGQGFAGRAAVLFGQRGAHLVEFGSVQLAHQFADELHLAAFAFEVADALGLHQGVAQFLR